MPKPKTGTPLDGIVLIDKPLGLSSNTALQKTKRIFNARKAGHTGSLDPLATGVLPICFGEATKISSFLLDSNKRYTTTIQLGFTRTTGDMEGEIVETRTVPDLNADAIEKVLSEFRGDVAQIPPMHSALKHEGTPLYKLARQGITIERKVRHIKVFELIALGFTPDTITLDVHCSKGTYIRTLAQDIREALGCGAHLIDLRRTEVEPFGGHPIYTLKQLTQLAASSELPQILLPIDAAIPHWPSITLTQDQAENICMGRRVDRDDIPDSDSIRLYRDNGNFLGIGQLHESGLLAARRLLRTD